ncbi:hypothetical protein NX059_005083 [Plenodomus lindquistii]|nr:hypothetical protein NX059_005083 [Plenodomus lindquistii]
MKLLTAIIIVLILPLFIHLLTPIFTIFFPSTSTSRLAIDLPPATSCVELIARFQECADSKVCLPARLLV